MKMTSYSQHISPIEKIWPIIKERLYNGETFMVNNNFLLKYNINSDKIISQEKALYNESLSKRL